MTVVENYTQFLQSKIVVQERTGFQVDEAELHPGNFPHQNAAIVWAARLGKALIAMSFGLGKTRIQCELGRLIHQRSGGKFLVICPLGVKRYACLVHIQNRPRYLRIAWKTATAADIYGERVMACYIRLLDKALVEMAKKPETPSKRSSANQKTTPQTATGRRTAHVQATE